MAWTIQSALVDGFIVFCMDRGAHLVGMTRERRLPFVTIDFLPEDSSMPGLWVDSVSGARMAARHLLDLGHRRFGVLALPAAEPLGVATAERLMAGRYSGTGDRIRGYFEELGTAGIDTAKIPIYETDNDEGTTRAAMEYLMAQKPRPTAGILAMSDRMALAALDWLAARGIPVPGDVSIVGFDVPGIGTLPAAADHHRPADAGNGPARGAHDPHARGRAPRPRGHAADTGDARHHGTGEGLDLRVCLPVVLFAESLTLRGSCDWRSALPTRPSCA